MGKLKLTATDPREMEIIVAVYELKNNVWGFQSEGSDMELQNLEIKNSEFESGILEVI